LTRASEALVALGSVPSSFSIRPVERADSDSLPPMMLDAYRGTVDDEGEGDDEARAAIDEYFARMEWRHSVVLEADAQLVAMSFVVVVNDRHYIDPVATMAAFKGRGFGRAAVVASLRSLASVGVLEVGAVITDGNTPSQRLFAGLGFVRVGSWAGSAST
jgi:L-amino acid N-acyltransferase YncA